MRQNLTTGTGARQAAKPAPRAAPLLRLSVAVLLGALFVILAYQIPARHTVDIGGYDAAYVQGFYETSRADALAPPAYLGGSDGRARWTRTSSFLLFPQIGLPAELTLRLRAAPNPPTNQRLTILLNGTTPLGEIMPDTEWRDYRYTINSGLTKISDVVIELRASQIASIGAEDTREVGVLLDQAVLQTTTWPITPYPAQLVFGALAGVLAWALFERWGLPGVRGQGSGEGDKGTRRRGEGEKRRQGDRVNSLQNPAPQPSVLNNRQPPTDNRQSFILQPLSLLVLGVMALLFLLFYRLQPLYPYPLRWLLPGINLVLAGLIALRYVPAAARRFLLLPDLASAAIALAWLGVVILSARQHLVLSVPGVEKDFSVFSARSAQLFGTFQPSDVYNAATDGVLRADGFYNLGYPFLLWLIRPLTFGNSFLAAQIVAASSGAVLLLATWWLARQLLGANGALLALICLACSPLVVQYGLYVGTDMPFAAACAMALALVMVDGGAWTAKDSAYPPSTFHRPPSWRYFAAGLGAGLAFLVRHPGIVLLPFGWLALLIVARQRAISWRDLRAPLLLFTVGFIAAVLPQLLVNLRDTGNPLWSQQAKNIWLAAYGNSDWANWLDAPNSIGFADVVLSDPARFFGNWVTNLRGFLGAGGEDISEFGRADQLRLLAFPANWLAISGLGAWLFRGGVRARLLLLWVTLYAIGVTVGLSILRFVLPLTPAYAIAAAWSVLWLGRKCAEWLETRPALVQRAPLTIALLLAALISGGSGIGTGFVLRNQPADELAAVELVQRHVAPSQRVQMERAPRVLFDEYSSIAHLVVSPGQAATFVLRPQEQAAQSGETPVESAGGYTLYRTKP